MITCLEAGDSFECLGLSLGYKRKLCYLLRKRARQVDRIQGRIWLESVNSQLDGYIESVYS